MLILICLISIAITIIPILILIMGDKIDDIFIPKPYIPIFAIETEKEQIKKEYEQEVKKSYSKIFIFIIVELLVFSSSMIIGINIDNNNYKIFSNKYQVQKYTIEQSLQNNNLSGLERVELVKQASELNAELSELKTRVGFWYNCHINDNIIKDLEYIKLEENNNEN